MLDSTYRKGSYTATVLTEAFDDGRFQGMVTLRDTRDGATQAATTHRVETLCATEQEAFDEAHALAHRLLADLGNA
ncbi:MAG: hypothetical protein ACRYG5_06095 [Janthinobacterium lividum]